MSNCPRICIVGAGVSGICTAVKLNKKGLTNYTIFDENEEFGGTWVVNTYPGCAADVPTHLYSFSFHQNSNWSSVFSPQQEILEYMKEVARTYNLYEKVKFQHQIKTAVWMESLQNWRVTVYDMTTNSESEESFDIIIGAVGGLRAVNVPKEFDAFNGPRMHSARWDDSITLEGKNVAVVGSGASAVQIIPAIAKSVKKLISYQRRPAWILPRTEFNYPSWTQWMFRNVPGVQTFQRGVIFLLCESHRPVYTFNSLFNKIFSAVGKRFIKSQVGNDPKLIKKLTPNYTIGLKRIHLSQDYYPAMKLLNVQVIREDIAEVRSKSIVTTDGVEEPIDVLILATGFKVQDLFAPLVLKGKDGIDVSEFMKTEDAATYLGIATSIAPNAFFLLGFNSSPGNNSGIFTIECQVKWTVRVIQEMVKRRVKTVSVKSETEKDYMNKKQEQLSSTVWAKEDGGNWQNNQLRPITALNPSTSTAYWSQTRRPDFAKLDFY